MVQKRDVTNRGSRPEKQANLSPGQRWETLPNLLKYGVAPTCFEDLQDGRWKISSIQQIQAAQFASAMFCIEPCICINPLAE